MSTDDPYRRKKSRCPGKRPVCSYCESLGQDCVYSESVELGPGANGMARRLENVEGKLEELFHSLNSRQMLTPVTVQWSPVRGMVTLKVDEEVFATVSHFHCSIRKVLLRLSGFGIRDSEIILAIQAISLRFEDEAEIEEAHMLDYAAGARSRTMDQINNGHSELSTLQTLYLLTTFESS
ncbi:hypothetical protein BBP40_012021, partial [Aspergillus hancockii]